MSEDPRQLREVALNRLLRAKRWILALSVTLTGVFTALAANAFPGKTLHTHASGGKSESGAGEPNSARTSSEASSGSVTAPEQAPQSGEQQESSGESSSAESSSGESGSTPEAPVISGGS